MLVATFFSITVASSICLQALHSVETYNTLRQHLQLLKNLIAQIFLALTKKNRTNQNARKA
jgi:hypothetical protein